MIFPEYKKWRSFFLPSLFAFVSQAITILVKSVKSNSISETQLQVLLGYAEEDIYDQSRQATAFGLLKVNLNVQTNQTVELVKTVWSF